MACGWRGSLVCACVASRLPNLAADWWSNCVLSLPGCLCCMSPQGEALIVDNYRAMHIREAYSDMSRFSWRVWMWVDGECHGPPSDVMSGIQHYKARGAGDRPAA